MSGKNTDDVIKQYFNNIQKCLLSNDDLSIGAALRLLCGLLSRGYSLKEFAPLIAQHVSNNCSEVEILSQMLMLQVTEDDHSSCLQAVNSLINSASSKIESKRLRAVKTLSNLGENSELEKVIRSVLQSRINDESSYVKKAIIVGEANLVKIDEDVRGAVKKMILSAFESGDSVLISGAIFAAEIIGETEMIVKASDKLWPVMLTLDPWAQSKALHYLLSTKQLAYQSILTILLHSQNSSVVFEAMKYFEDDIEKIVPPLIRLIYEQSVVSIHAFAELEKISRKNPKILVNYSSHFLPPQPSEAAAHLSVLILGNIGIECSSILRKWALNYNNQFAAHFIGKIKDIEGLIMLLKSASEPIAEIAAFYAAKNVDQFLLAQLLEFEKIKPSVVSVFTDSCKNNVAISESMMKILVSKYDELSREVKNEASLLAVRLIECSNSTISKEFLYKTGKDSNPDVLRRSKVLQIMLSSPKPQIKNAIWTTRDPPPPSPPVIYLPQID